MSDLDTVLISDISLAHERFVSVMEQRLPALPLETKERYFAVLNMLIGKLESPDKSLREILTEMMAEAASHLLAEMQASR
jgi:hypothetical protein